VVVDPCFDEAEGFSKRRSTVICCAGSNIPSIDKVRLENQNADANQYASWIPVQEKEPITAAARMAHYQRRISQSEGLKPGPGGILVRR
jgi:hypothetical protein